MVLRLAHEIRNPLATIKSAAQLIEHLQSPEGEIAEFFASIHTEITRIDSVVRDMQRFVRLDTHTAARVDLEQAVESATQVDDAVPEASRSRLRIVGGPPTTVVIDPQQLEAALAELISNALRFSADMTTVDVRWSHEDGRVVIEIEDHGQGIAETHRERVLRPFYSTSTQGTGLGLNIVTRTARLAGGELRLSSTTGRGTIATLVLPRI
jgi:signal transduction histidine kinase